MTLLATAVATLHRGLTAAAGESVTYRRGNLAITPLERVIFATPRLDDYGDELARLSVKGLDAIVWRADLHFEGEGPTDPRVDDEIDRLDPLGVRRTYRVRLDANERCFRPTGDPQLQLRIHLVEIPTASEAEA